MNLHQQNLWRHMISLIQSYLDGHSHDFYNLTGQLEGDLDSAEITDKQLIEDWYSYWTPLEIRRSIQGTRVDENEARKELLSMQTFLLSKL